MKKSTLFLSLAMMLSLSVSLFAEMSQEKNSDCMIPPPPQFQQGRDCNDDFMPFLNKGKFNKKFCDEKIKDLNLSDNQKEALKALKNTNFKSKIELEKQFREKMKALDDELLKEKYSTKEVKKLSKDIKDISSKLIDTKISKKEGMRKILTTEQYNKMFKVKTHYDILAERLGLSPEQKENFVKILKTKQEKEKVLRTELREKDMALKKEFDKENIDKDTISKLSEEISNITKDLFKLDIDTKLEIKSVLTAEQYNKFMKPCPNPRKPIIYEPTDCDKNIDK